MSLPIFNNDVDLRNSIQKYFEENKSNVTITGLAYYLGFASRQSFYDYENDERYSYTIKRARLFMESVYEGQLLKGNVAGAIFALKNFGWSDKQEIDQKTEHSGTIGFSGIEIIKPNDPNSDQKV